MYNIIITNKVTGSDSILDTVKTEKQAERFCEAWGWSYDDGERSYWLSYEKLPSQSF